MPPCRSYSWRKARSGSIRKALPSGENGGHRYGDGEDRDGGEIRRGVQIADAVEPAPQELRQPRRGAHARNEAGSHRTGKMAQHDRQHLRGLRAQRHADADFPGPLRNRVAHYADNPQARQKLRDRAQQADSERAVLRALNLVEKRGAQQFHFGAGAWGPVPWRSRWRTGPDHAWMRRSAPARRAKPGRTVPAAGRPGWNRLSANLTDCTLPAIPTTV